MLKCARSRFGRFNPTDYCQSPISLRSKLPALFWLPVRAYLRAPCAERIKRGLRSLRYSFFSQYFSLAIGFARE